MQSANPLQLDLFGAALPANAVAGEFIQPVSIAAPAPAAQGPRERLPNVRPEREVLLGAQVIAELKASADAEVPWHVEPSR